HITRYEGFARYMAANNFIVVGYDQRGHGLTLQSMENMGYMSDIDNFEILVSDLFSVSEYVKNKFPELPVFILGHSMGSFVLQRFVQMHGNDINGAIFSGSALNKGLLINVGYFLASLITKCKGRRYRSKLMDNLSLGPFNKPFKPNRTKVDWLSRDEEIVDQYVKDEYCGQLFTVSYFKDLSNGFKTINKNFEIIPKNLPMYLFSGAEDPVGGQGKLSKKLYDVYKEAGMMDVEFKLYPGGRHEMLNEINKEDVYQDILKWLNKHL
ncbi:MAG: lysophospholipase, partial [Bacilli bacterium]|nr:lysophospholipase [Bacilli bacterium]